MQKVFGLILCVCLLFSGNCFAMQFSQPIEIGGIGVMQAGGGGIYVDGADYNDGKFYTKYRKDNTRGYEKGIAGFGNGKDSLYVHYKYNVYEGFYFGGKDKNNTIKDDFPRYDIYKMNTNENITIYILSKIYGPEFDYLIIGKRADDKFVKYIDTREITKRYFGWNGESASPVMYRNLSVQNDTLTMEYQRYGNKQRIQGKFYFKWDDKAQWFGIAQGKEEVVRSGY